MGKPKYPVGYKFNHLTISEFLSRMDNTTNHSYYKCICDCGKEIRVLSSHIQEQKSCGCMPRRMKKL